MPRSWRSASNATWQLPPGCSPISGRSTTSPAAIAVDRSAGRGDEHERIGAQQAVLDAVVLVEVPPDDEGQVELAGLQRGHDLVEVVVLHAADVQLRGLAEDRADDSGEDLDGHALERADRQPAAAGQQRVDVPLGLTQLIEHGGGVHEQCRADRGELDAPRPAGRSNTLWPSTRSSPAICWLIPDWLKPRRSAARPNEPSAATAWRAWRWRSSTSWRRTGVFISRPDHTPHCSSLCIIIAAQYPCSSWPLTSPPSRCRAVAGSTISRGRSIAMASRPPPEVFAVADLAASPRTAHPSGARQRPARRHAARPGP